MATMLLSLCLAALEASCPSPGAVPSGCRDVGILAEMVKGRALARFVKKGMTQEQVQLLLGENASRITLGYTEFWHYRYLGLTVWFDWKTGTVDSVTDHNR